MTLLSKQENDRIIIEIESNLDSNITFAELIKLPKFSDLNDDPKKHEAANNRYNYLKRTKIKNPQHYFNVLSKAHDREKHNNYSPVRKEKKMKDDNEYDTSGSEEEEEEEEKPKVKSGRRKKTPPTKKSPTKKSSSKKSTAMASPAKQAKRMFETREEAEANGKHTLKLLFYESGHLSSCVCWVHCS